MRVKKEEKKEELRFIGTQFRIEGKAPIKNGDIVSRETIEDSIFNILLERKDFVNLNENNQETIDLDDSEA